MELFARKEDMYLLMDEQAEDKRFVMMNAAIIVVMLVIFVVTGGNYPLTVAWIIVLSLINFIRGYRSYKEKDRMLMDISDCYIRLNEGVLQIRQIAGNELYETCKIPVEDIRRVVEEYQIGNAGFYIYVDLKERTLMDTVTGAEDLFFVRAFGYELNEFKELYRKLISELNAETEVIASIDQLAWGVHVPTAFRRMYRLFILYLIPFVVHLVLYIIALI